MTSARNILPIQLVYNGDLYKAYFDPHTGLLDHVLCYISKLPNDPDVLRPDQVPTEVLNKVCPTKKS